MTDNRMKRFGLLVLVFFLGTFYPGAASSRIETGSSDLEVNIDPTETDAGGRFDLLAVARHASSGKAKELNVGLEVPAHRKANLDPSTTDDPSVQWTQANPLTIEVDTNSDAWHAGRASDVLALDSGSSLAQIRRCLGRY